MPRKHQAAAAETPANAATNTVSPPVQQVSAAQMDHAVSLFRKHGDFRPLLRLISGEEAPQFAIQRALSKEPKRSARDALEDVSFLLSQGKDRGPDMQRLQEDVERGVKEEYGAHALDLVGSRILPITEGLLGLCDPPPPVNCIIAILGLEARRAAADTLHISQENLGQEISVFRVDCSSCGKGGGQVVCPDCLKRAKQSVVKEPLYQAMLKIAKIQDDPATREAHARMLLRDQPQRFGCANCNHQPIRICECLREVQVPDRPREGEILKGTYVASGKDWYCCVQLA